MKKSYELEELDCANCAAKMEAAMNKLPGIEKATVSFMTSRLAITVADDANLPEILDACQKTISKIHADCRIVIK